MVIVLVVIICVMARKRRAEKEDEEQPKNEGELLSNTSPSDQTFNYQQDWVPNHLQKKLHDKCIFAICFHIIHTQNRI